MASLRIRFLNQILRWTIRRKLTRAETIEEVKAAMNGPLMPSPRGVNVSSAVLGGVDGEWSKSAKGAPIGHMLYLHGGGYVALSARSHRALTGQLALRGLEVFAPNYRLAPEHSFPAALEDALASWRALRAKISGPLFVAGDSAGGGLALALTMRLRDEGEAPPDGAVFYSPWTDLTGTSLSYRNNGGRDAMFPNKGLDLVGAAYAGDAALTDPAVSPLFGSFEGLPPLLFFVGEDEILLDDSRGAAERAKAAGVLVDLRIWPTVPHVWPIFGPFFPESRRALDQSADFLRSLLNEG